MRHLSSIAALLAFVMSVHTAQAPQGSAAVQPAVERARAAIGGASRTNAIRTLRLEGSALQGIDGLTGGAMKWPAKVTILVLLSPLLTAKGP